MRSVSSAMPERLTRVLLLAGVFSFTYRGYWFYSLADRAGLSGYLDLAAGRGEAPFQYRIGAVKTAAWAYSHAHFPFRYSFTLLDFAGLLISLFLGYRLLRQTAIYQRANSAVQWLGSAAYLAVVFYLMSWQDFYKKPETMPTAGLLMLMLWLWTARAEDEALVSRGAKGSRLGRVAGLLVVAVAVSLLRTEYVAMVSAGVFLAAWWGGRSSLGRGAALAVSAVCAAISVTTQLVMSKVVYPQAHYAPGGLFMLPGEVRRPNEILCFVVFVLPAAWTLREVWRRKFLGDAAGVGFLLGAIPFVALWVVIGRLEEVRIFLPLALALAPIAVEMVMLRAEESLPEAARTR